MNTNLRKESKVRAPSGGLRDGLMGFSGLIGIGRRDITPPVGIYARQWGAAKHDVAEGVHRPLVLTVISFQENGGGQPLVLVAMDGFMFRVPEDEYSIRKAVMDGVGVGQERVILNISHTHASCSISSIDSEKPGGELIGPYLERIRQAVCEAGNEAVKSAESSVLDWEQGKCRLARNRDLPDPAGGRRICGYNPGEAADDTLLVGRITCVNDGRVSGIVVNYACHPTTLGWDNRLISSDYVGAMREVVEEATGAPVAFLQGASGELAPRRQYTESLSVADANGRELGHAVLSVLTSLFPPGMELAYSGVQESGAPLALWELRRAAVSGGLLAAHGVIDFPLKPQPSEAEVLKDLEQCGDRTLRERLNRKLARIRHLGSGPSARIPFWTWKVGDAVFVAQPNEAYSYFQVELRRKFALHPVVVMNLANGASGSYVYPAEVADQDIYQVWVSPFQPEALPLLVATCVRTIESGFEGRSISVP